ncbi:hypothetical protein V1517DRAFT_321051 [Lipomyces orientalis]|uniref:Uncharacterized protein n=1 Tax=Lipomyces orientalis TaxID=1233043 RepID=A0ACC3TQ04_9ASCO
MTATQHRLPPMQGLHHNVSADDDAHLPHSMQALTNAFNPVISHDSPPPARSPRQQGHQHPQHAYYPAQDEYQQSAAQHAQHAQQLHPVYQGRPNICLCPQVTRVPRPRNAFILYRQHHHAAVVAEHPGKTNPEISKIIGEQWRQLSPEEKAVWQKLGDEEKKSHLERFPDYRYQPRRNAKRNGNDVHNNGHNYSNGPPGLSTIAICSKCHGQTPNSRGALLPKPPVSLENGVPYPQKYLPPPSPPNGSGNTLAPMLTSPSQSQRLPSFEPTNPYLSGITLPPTSTTTVAAVSSPALHPLPPILPLPKDDVLSTSASSATSNNSGLSSVSSTSPPRPFADVRTRSLDDARQGVEALLSLTHAQGGSPSPEMAPAKPTTLPTSIRSIINLESDANRDGQQHKRRCRSNSSEHETSRYSPPSSHHDSDSESHTAPHQPGYYVPRIAAPVSNLPPIQQSSHAYDDDSRLIATQGEFFRAVPNSEKLREAVAIGVHLPRDRPRGAVIAIDGNPAAVRWVVAELVRRIDQLAVCEANRVFCEAGAEDDSMPGETKLLTKALAVHKEVNSVYTFVNARKSVLLDRYVMSFATDSLKMLNCVQSWSSSPAAEYSADGTAVSSSVANSDGLRATTQPAILPTQRKVAEDWYWCANLYRGTVAPDLIINVCFHTKEIQRLTLAGGRTKALLVSGVEHIGVMEQEVREIMSEVGKY